MGVRRTREKGVRMGKKKRKRYPVGGIISFTRARQWIEIGWAKRDPDGRWWKGIGNRDRKLATTEETALLDRAQAAGATGRER